MIDNGQEKLSELKQKGKILRIISLVTGVAVAVVLVAFCLMPAMNLKTDGGKYVNGYNYYGWQLIFLGCGYPPIQILCMFEPAGLAAGDYVPGSYDFGFNATTFLGLILPIVAIVVCAIVAKRMKNRGKAVCEVVAAVAILAGGIILLNIGALSQNVATDMGAGVGFKKQYLIPAIEAGTYKTLFYPIFTFAVCLLTAIVKCARAAFLVYQRKVALKIKNNKELQK